MKSDENVRKSTIIEPSPEFHRFIEAVNAYRGYESFLRDHRADFEENKRNLPCDIETIKLHTFRQLECPPFKKYILHGKEIDIQNPLRFIRAVRRYETFYGLRELFIEIMSEVEYLRERKDFPPKEHDFFLTGRPPASMYITSDGYYYESRSSEIFENVDLAKIRICICGNYFWASRKDKNCCSPECGNRARQRKFLDDENKRKEYNEKRLQYYHENKEAIKERKNKKRR